MGKLNLLKRENLERKNNQVREAEMGLTQRQIIFLVSAPVILIIIILIWLKIQQTRKFRQWEQDEEKRLGIQQQRAKENQRDIGRESFMILRESMTVRDDSLGLLPRKDSLAVPN